MSVTDKIPPSATEPVETRSLISPDEAARLTRLFKIFANETRLRLLHVLVREGEVCVGDLATSLQMKPQAVSNQLQRLVDRGIVAPRREGNSVYYHIVDPCVPVLLERGLCLTECCPEEVAGGCCAETAEPCCNAPQTSAASLQPAGLKKKTTNKTASRKGQSK